MLAVDWGDYHELAGHPSATARVRAPQLEGGLVHENDALLHALPLLKLPSKPGSLLHQLSLLSLGDPSYLLGLLVGNPVAGIDQGKRLGRYFDLVLLLYELAASFQGEKAHFVKDIIRDQLLLEGRGELPSPGDTLVDVVVVAVPITVVTLDHVLDGLVEDTSRLGDAADGGHGLREVRKRPVAPQEKVLYLRLCQPLTPDPLQD